MLTVVTPASDRTLLTDAELRSAVGSTPPIADGDLAALNHRVAAAITRHCRIAAAGTTPPTLRQETLSEQFRLTCRREAVKLARRPIASITSVTYCGALLGASDYEVDTSAGLMWRLSADCRVCWSAGKLVVVYIAGWQTVPHELKLAAAKLASAIYQEGTRDPNLKRVRIEGLSEREYWVPPTSDPLIPSEVADLLSAFINISLS